MKKLILFSLLSILLMSCGTSTGDPEVDTISIGVAFSIVSKSWSYWIFIILSMIPAVGYIYLYAKGKFEEIDLRVLFGFIALIMFAIFFRPCEIAANTSVAAFNRGNIIGY